MSEYSPASAKRHAIVTGGSRGLGRSVATLMAARGYQVSILARDAAQLENAAAAIPGRVGWAAADVTDRAEVERAITGVVTESGPCDVLVAAAGAAHPGYFTQLEDDAFRSQIQLNYFGVLNAVRAVVPAMVARRSGTIVGVASTAALVGVYGYSAYAPAKFAVRGLMEVLRSELKPHGIHVACAFPPDMDTPGFSTENKSKPEEAARISAGIRLRKPDDVARALVRGIDRRRFIITADPQTAVLARGAGLLAPILHHVTDTIVRKVQRERA